MIEVLIKRLLSLKRQALPFMSKDSNSLSHRERINYQSESHSFSSSFKSNASRKGFFFASCDAIKSLDPHPFDIRQNHTERVIYDRKRDLSSKRCRQESAGIMLIHRLIANKKMDKENSHKKQLNIRQTYRQKQRQ